MPSLEQLKNFKASFGKIANEGMVLAQLDQPPDDLPLPGSEPAAPVVPEAPVLEPEESTPGFDFDFADLLGSDPESLPPLPAAEPTLEETQAVDLDLPDMGDAALAAGFSDIADTPDVSTEAGDDTADSDALFSDMDDADFASSFPDLPDMDVDLPGFDAEEPLAEEDFGDAFSDMPGGNPEEGEGEGVDLQSGDPFEEFSPDGKGDALNGGEGTGDAGEGIPDIDFSMPDLDDVLGSDAPAGFGIEPDADLSEPEEVVEEIRLSEGDFEKLRETIANYPLNLRIAIEGIIAEQVIAPNLMSSLIKLLVRGGSPKEVASLAEKILNKSIPIPKGFEKKTGEELEQEQASFPYVFVHKFLPVLRLFLVIALLAASVFYLGYTFIFTPLRANSIYKQGYELIPTGAYTQANERFNRAFRIHRQKDWFYRYAEKFRDERQYIYAEEKYDQLLTYYPKDKKGALDYAGMETYSLQNYDKANRIIRRYVLDYSVDDKEGLLAFGDNNLLWGEQSEAEKDAHYEDARSAYARLLEVYGWKDDIVERMLRYFIRVDNLGEVLPLQQYFMSDPKRRKISAPTLAELGGYLLDKRFEEVRGVPDEHIGQIGGIRDVLLQAVQAAPRLPEAHYHLARYYNRFGNSLEERQTLEIAARAFDVAPEEKSRRTQYRLNTQRRLGEILINSREFFAAEEQLIKGIGIYEDALDRRLFTRDPQFGRLYADLGDLEYFTRSGNMPRALEYYLQAERNGWSPPEMQYRIGSAYYQQGQWAPALDRFFAVSTAIPPNRRLLNALGNVSYMRGNYFAAQGYYNRLMTLLDTERARFPMLMPNDRPEHLELAERMMTVRNNLAVTLEALTRATGNRSYRSRALGLYTESARAWDSLTRNPTTMIRAGAGDFGSPGMNLAFLNSRNTLYPEPDYEPQLYIQIDKDVLEPSVWEELVPQDFRLTEVLEPYLPQ
ncbi:hypothetical protein AGMMS49942_00870 [Spirochaetia bacterium]|nr:hypothetical protein AGMMS49942_00870 [Spirochaetia bacterium]